MTVTNTLATCAIIALTAIITLFLALSFTGGNRKRSGGHEKKNVSSGSVSWMSVLFAPHIVGISIGLLLLIGICVLLLWQAFLFVASSTTGGSKAVDSGVVPHYPQARVLVKEGEWKPYPRIIGDIVIPASSAEDPSWAFAAVIPPFENCDYTVSLTGLDPDLKAYIVAGPGVGNKPYSAEYLAHAYDQAYRQQTESRRDQPPTIKVKALPIESFPFVGKIANGNRYTPKVLYLQTNQPEQEHTFYFELQKGENKSEQWFVSLDGLESASFTVPPAGTWRAIWIVPIYDSRYLSTFGGNPVFPKGIDISLLPEEVTRDIEQQDLDVAAVMYQGLYYDLDGQKEPIVGNKTFLSDEDGSSMQGKRITLGINALSNEETKSKPAKIVVGVLWK